MIQTSTSSYSTLETTEGWFCQERMFLWIWLGKDRIKKCKTWSHYFKNTIQAARPKEAATNADQSILTGPLWAPK